MAKFLVNIKKILENGDEETIEDREFTGLAMLADLDKDHMSECVLGDSYVNLATKIANSEIFLTASALAMAIAKIKDRETRYSPEEILIRHIINGIGGKNNGTDF